MQEVMDMLDANGDGIVSLDEWCAMPEEFRKGLRKLGDSVLKLGAASAPAPNIKHSQRISEHDHRAKQRQKDEEDKAVKKRVAHLYENKHHLEAARSGQSAVEIDLFKM
eukprot:SAG31_NODE_10674_length_1111_cov_1.481225_3_plen_108_part_01